jgi:tRNA (guanine37-N1)-methyltransferase
MLFEPLAKAMDFLAKTSSEKKNQRKIYLSPTGTLLNEKLVQELSQEEELVLLCGRYGGVDQRFLNHYAFESVSVGDYVVSGGELPALLLIDAVLRKKPGVLGNESSSKDDSFASSPYFEAPLLTRPRENFAGKVPDILLSGDHKKIEDFRKWLGLALTVQWRPELVNSSEFLALKKYLCTVSREDLKTMGLNESFLERFYD